jgi:hypothetical protein
MKIILNAIKCLHCGDKLVSTHRHDFKFCKCKSVAVDGGEAYLRRLGQRADYQEASVIEIRSTDPLQEYAGMFAIFSPGGKTPPSTAFFRKEDAMATARAMRERYKGDWYIITLEPVPT